jgi:catechol 2,3-dioxygenase-like lactoylglutathione lyase family enzyme
VLDHIILTVSDVERSLAFYDAALKPLSIRFFMPYKGEDGHPGQLEVRRRKESVLLAEARRA